MSLTLVRPWRQTSRCRRFSTQVSILLHFRSVWCENNCLALGSSEYTEAMRHFSTVNIKESTCVVQPATQEHVAKIVRVSFSPVTKGLIPLSDSSGRCPRRKRRLL